MMGNIGYVRAGSFVNYVERRLIAGASLMVNRPQPVADIVSP